MTKLLTAIAATFLAIAAIASGAEAGFNVRINAPTGFSEVHKAGCGGGGGYGRSYRRAAYQSVRRTKRRVEVASRKVSKPAVVAKAEPKAEPKEAAPRADVAEVENFHLHDDGCRGKGCRGEGRDAGEEADEQKVACRQGSRLQDLLRLGRHDPLGPLRQVTRRK